MLKRSSLRAKALALVTGLLLAALGFTGASASSGSVPIADTVGEVSDSDADFAGFHLRYVGSPAPSGYSHSYQWATPHIETQPEDGPVVFEGTIDLRGRVSETVATIGLLDKAGLDAGFHEYQDGSYLYISNLSSGDVRIAPTDGNAGGGEIIQTSMTVPAAVADAGLLSVTFTVDGTADPATCAAPVGSSAGAEGCLTVTVDGIGTRSDSYGAVTGAGGPDEFATGAIPGWEAFPSGSTGVIYDFTISPAHSDPQNKEQCKNGGWESFGFKNQGQCIRFVQTGKDSRNGG